MELERTLNRLNSVGLTPEIKEMVLITDEPKFPEYICSLKKENADEEIIGHSIDQNRIRAQVKAAAEFLERFCLETTPENGYFLGKYCLDSAFVDPALFFCYSKEQGNDMDKIREDVRTTSFSWWPVTEVVSKREMAIPAQLVFLSGDLDTEFPIRKERISTGAALGELGKNEAVQRGLLECIERDACISSYLTRKPVCKITNLPVDLEDVISYLRRYQLEPHIFDVTTDIDVPSVLVVTIDRTGIGTAVNVGSAADFTYHDAVKHAILESVQCRRIGRIAKPLLFPKNLPTEDEITSINNRLYYWHSLDRIKDLSFWLETKKTVSYHSLQDVKLKYEDIVTKIAGKKYHFFVADITHPLLKENGFEVVKVIIPELHPLYLDERAKALYSVHHGEIKDDKTLKPHPLT